MHSAGDTSVDSTTRHSPPEDWQLLQVAIRLDEEAQERNTVPLRQHYCAIVICFFIELYNYYLA